MHRRRFLKLSSAAVMAAAYGARPANAEAGATPEKPNIILIMTDNHAAWTLGCYGNSEIRTPNLDRMAEEGALFERAFCNNAVCSPTRASTLTGLMPCQNGVHKYINNSVMLGPTAYPALGEFDTLPQVLYENGYTCGLSGKWHLGANLHPQEGFTFWVSKPGGSSSGFVNQEVVEDGEIREEPTHQTAYYTHRGIDFIRENQNNPFFLFLAYNAPYGLGGTTTKPAENPHWDSYKDKEMVTFPREEPHPWLHNYRDIMDDPLPRRAYAAEVSYVDEHVGMVLDELETLGLDENTLVIFMGDQGLSGGHGGFWGMGDHTRPFTAYERMIHIPLIFWQPGRVQGGQRRPEMVANYDLMRTLLHYAGMPDAMPAVPASPGRDFSRMLEGDRIDWENEVFYEFENLRGIRTTDWKYLERYGEGPDELYHLAEDPEEQHNLIDSDAHGATRQQLRQRMQAFFDQYAQPQWDLWHGGRAKGGLLAGYEVYE